MLRRDPTETRPMDYSVPPAREIQALMRRMPGLGEMQAINHLRQQRHIQKMRCNRG